MDRTLRVKLEKEEYLEYLSHQLMHSKKMRGSRWFLLTSVPAVLVTGMLLLKSGSILFYTSVIALTAFWILYGAGTVWKNYVRRKTERYYWPKLNIQEFKEIRYHFAPQGIEYREDSGKIEVPYSEIQTLVPVEKIFVLYHKKGVILLPYRIFKDEEDMKGFLKGYEQNRRGAE